MFKPDYESRDVEKAFSAKWMPELITLHLFGCVVSLDIAYLVIKAFGKSNLIASRMVTMSRAPIVVFAELFVICIAITSGVLLAVKLYKALKCYRYLFGIIITTTFFMGPF